MSATTIQWTNHTVNFWWGCTKVSPACAHCYAENIARRFGSKLFGHPVTWGDGHPRGNRVLEATREAFTLNDKALKARGPRPRVFVNSMSDWLDEQVPADWLADLLDTVLSCPHLDFQLLTKRPENFRPRLEAAAATFYSPRTPLLAWLNGSAPPNVWIGTTVEDQQRANERLPHLLQIPARVRFLSCEPLLGHVVLPSLAGIHWVIAGGESGAAARPMHPVWLDSLVNQCETANVPFFFKQWGSWSPNGPVYNHWDFIDGSCLPPHWHKFPAQYCCMNRNGDLLKSPESPGNSYFFKRLGTHKAGRLLDGIEHNAFPP